MELLITSYLNAKEKDRLDLLQPRRKQDGEEKDSAIFLTTTYNPSYNGLPNQVRKTWDLLDRSSSTRDLHSLTLKVGLRRPKNLRDILVKSKLHTPGDEEKKSLDLSCIAYSCRYCPELKKTWENHFKGDRPKISLPKKGHIQVQKMCVLHLVSHMQETICRPNNEWCQKEVPITLLPDP